MTRWLYLSVALTLLALGASLYVWNVRYDDLPENVPTHWDANFNPDGFAPKQEVWKVFFILPLVMAGLCGLTLLLPWLSPKHFEVDTFRGTYGYIMMLVVALMGYLHVATLWGAMQPEENRTIFMRFFLGGICLFLALLGNVLGKVRRNFWMGVRTPWTLASEAVWNQTHRLAAWLFVAAGLAGFALVMALPAGAAWVPLTVIVPAALVPVIYSLVLYKRLEREGKLEPPAATPNGPSKEVHAG
ncbi:MAG TPA: SdpI family protein [Gemmataceae bacterium]|nr:SdpI family protein [Gemmataceae bacterium]